MIVSTHPLRVGAEPSGDTTFDRSAAAAAPPPPALTAVAGGIGTVTELGVGLARRCDRHQGRRRKRPSSNTKHESLLTRRDAACPSAKRSGGKFQGRPAGIPHSLKVRPVTRADDLINRAANHKPRFTLSAIWTTYLQRKEER